MIKVEQTQKHPTDKATIGGVVGWVPVTEAKLVFIESHSKTLSIFNKETKDFVKPILISETEKIEVGDWAESEGLIGKCISIDSKFYYLEIGKNDIISRRKDSCFKLLALPEHFSPEQLQMIVDGKLKDKDKVLVECELFFTAKTGVSILRAERERNYKIKLNPHITIYPVEPVLLIDKLVEVWSVLQWYEEQSDVRHEKYGELESWFKQNIK